jgi:hypothetical protein
MPAMELSTSGRANNQHALGMIKLVRSAFTWWSNFWKNFYPTVFLTGQTGQTGQAYSHNTFIRPVLFFGNWTNWTSYAARSENINP